MTNQELLDAVRESIRRVTLGQTAEWDGDRVTLADLDKLHDVERDLQRRVNTERRQGAGDYGSARYQTATFVR